MHGIEYEDDSILAITFNTAWSPPEGVITKLREKFPDVSFSVFMMNQEWNQRGTIKWHVVTSAETLMMNTQTENPPLKHYPIINPTFIITGNIP